MKWLQAKYPHLFAHKYAINAKQLGDEAHLAWSNLGYWDEQTASYPMACRQLADQLAQAVQLNSTDRLLDLGCGQGASLLYWQQQYKLAHIEAVELQAQCVTQIRHYLPQLFAIYQQSFLELASISFPTTFDVVVCIDAAYHSNLNSFLESVNVVLHSEGRLGFHYLILSEKWRHLNTWQKKKYRYLLKAADVNLNHLMTRMQFHQVLQDQAFEDIQICNLSQAVLKGFANYAQQLPAQAISVDRIKIQMTAKLCHRLYRDGFIEYVQVSAKKQPSSVLKRVIQKQQSLTQK